MSQQNIQPVNADAEARLEAAAIAELERLQRARDAKRSDYQPKRRRRYVNRQ